MTDQAKIDIFGSHSSYYLDIWDECELWVREKWEIWDEEKPEWFTDRIKACVPKEMIPSVETAQEDEVLVRARQAPFDEAKGRAARKSSITIVGDALVDAARTSVKSLEQ